MKTWPPGTSVLRRPYLAFVAYPCRLRISCLERTVNRGTGCRFAPSRLGGILHTPPLPLRSFAWFFSSYSTMPYGGSVTTACMELAGRSDNHFKASQSTYVVRSERWCLGCSPRFRTRAHDVCSRPLSSLNQAGSSAKIRSILGNKFPAAWLIVLSS